MQFVPAAKPRSAWRVLILFFAALLTFGVLAPVVASAHGSALLRVHNSKVVEPDQGYTIAHVKISLDHRVGHKVSVGYFTQSLPPGSSLRAAQAWKDYKPTAGRAYIPTWHKSTRVHVKVYGDKRVEGNEFFLVKLTHPRGVRIVDRVGLVKIIDNDKAPTLPILYVGDVQATEGGVPHVKVYLSKPAVAAVTFHFVTSNGSAKDTMAANQTGATAADFQSRTGDKTIAKGDTYTLIGVPTFKDGVTEQAEDFFVQVSGVVHATVHNSTGEVTIAANTS
jgi:hypothetical protein